MGSDVASFIIIFFYYFFLLTNFKIAYIDKDTIIITDITHITSFIVVGKLLK